MPEKIPPKKPKRMPPAAQVKPQKAVDATPSFPPLTDLSHLELVRLRVEIDNILRKTPIELTEKDLLLEFDITLRSGNNVVVRNASRMRINSALSLTSLPEIPGVMESLFYTSVWRPIRIGLMDYLNDITPTSSPLPEPSTTSLYELPGSPRLLPMPPGE